jgi:hypothetical protein
MHISEKSLSFYAVVTVYRSWNLGISLHSRTGYLNRYRHLHFLFFSKALFVAVRTIPDLHYIQATCEIIDFERKLVHYRDAFHEKNNEIEYDHLVIAPGSETNTWGVKGVLNNSNVFFLKRK